MDDLAALVAKHQITDTITELFVATDDRDWKTVVACLAPQVWFDVSSLTGAPASTTAAADIVAAWENGLAPLQAVHHQAGNFKVVLEGEQAKASCYGIASHYLPNASGRNTRIFVGSYDFELEKDGARWRVTHFRFNLKYVDGNLDLERS